MKNIFLSFFKLIFILSLSTFNLIAQEIKRDSTDLTFTGTKVNPYSQEFDTTGKIIFSGYCDTYFASYTDSSYNGYQKFPTASPRNNQFGLNILQFSAKYQSEKFRGVATIFYGDIPKSAWSNYLNFIQEANMGFKLSKRIWLDAGYFRTHIGLESIQPRENIAISFATTSYFEPYYMSGAKLTFEKSEKWTFQLNAFNGFSTFEETNNKKAYGFSTVYTPNKKLNVTLSTLLTDESPQYYPNHQLRSYTDLIAVYKTNRITLGGELNFGYQENSGLVDSTKSAIMFSSLLAAKYRITEKYAGYLRCEYFYDPNEILTGKVLNDQNQYVGLEIGGLTIGFEYKPIPNSYFRIEGRMLKTSVSNEIIFQNNGKSSNSRGEILIGLGVWL